MGKWLNLGLLLTVMACNVKPEDRNQQIAKGYCDCTATLFELNKKAATGAGNIDFQAIQTEFNQSKTCVFNLLTRWGKPDSLPNDAIMKVLHQKCPEAAKQTELLKELLTQ